MTDDLFKDHRLPDGGEKFVETRLNTKPLLADKVWRPLCVQHVYLQGYMGIKLSKLVRYGAVHKWWQPKAPKHFGEKMRVAFGTGLIFVPVHAGASKLKHIVVVHPAFVRIKLDHPVLQNDYDRMRAQMLRQDYVRQDPPHE